MTSYFESTSSYFCYGSQEQRSLFPFNSQSIKQCMIKLGDNTVPGRKIWIDVKINDIGQLECVLYPSASCNLSRLMWEQSALELKCRDQEFIPSLIQVYKECNKEDKDKIILGLGYQENLYREEKKFRHAKFFNELIPLLTKK